MNNNSYLSRKLNINMFSVIAMMILALLCLTGCTQKENKPAFFVYDINRDSTKLVANEYTFSNDFTADSEAKSHYVGEALQRMIVGPSQQDIVGAIGTQIGAVTYRIEGNVVTIDFQPEYYNASVSQRVLRFAAIVRTLCQIDGVTGVELTVNHEPILDSKGQVVGVATPDSFLGNDDIKINDYEKTNVHLYFASEDGTMLKEVTKPVVYSGNIMLERVVVDNLVAGPRYNQNALATINPATKVANVTVKDGICYVNLSSDFLTKTTAVSDEVVIYSIVNSLTRLSNENKVQIMIDGETEVSFGSIYLSTPFESNYDLLMK